LTTISRRLRSATFTVCRTPETRDQTMRWTMMPPPVRAAGTENGAVVDGASSTARSTLGAEHRRAPAGRE